MKTRGFEKISKSQFLKDVKGLRIPVKIQEIPSITEIHNEFILDSNYENIKIPQRATLKSAGYDFYSLFDFELYPGHEIILPTGIKSYMQDDEQLDIRVRSSSGFKYNIRLKNQLGLIDSDYYNNPKNEGHMWIALKNEGDKIWTVKQGEAIAQGTFHKYLITDNDHPINQERIGGIGSTNE